MGGSKGLAPLKLLMFPFNTPVIE